MVFILTIKTLSRNCSNSCSLVAARTGWSRKPLSGLQVVCVVDEGTYPPSTTPVECHRLSTSSPQIWPAEWRQSYAMRDTTPQHPNTTHVVVRGREYSKYISRGGQISFSQGQGMAQNPRPDCLFSDGWVGCHHLKRRQGSWMWDGRLTRLPTNGVCGVVLCLNRSRSGESLGNLGFTSANV